VSYSTDLVPNGANPIVLFYSFTGTLIWNQYFSPNYLYVNALKFTPDVTKLVVAFEENSLFN
jgi:hypothetical protein